MMQPMFSVGEYVRIGLNISVFAKSNYSIAQEMIREQGQTAKIKAIHYNGAEYFYLIGEWWYKEEMLELLYGELDKTSDWFKSVTGVK